MRYVLQKSTCVCVEGGRFHRNLIRVEYAGYAHGKMWYSMQATGGYFGSKSWAMRVYAVDALKLYIAV